MRSEDRTIASQSLAVALAVAVFGLAFGALAREEGLPISMTMAMSALVFAGSAQFAAVAIVDAGGTTAAAVVAGLLLNTRSLALGVAIAPLLPRRLATRALAAQLLIDESAATALAQPTASLARRSFWTTGIAVFALWNLATALGAQAAAVGDLDAVGLDAVAPAAFLALLAPRLGSGRERRVALAGAVIALAVTPLAPAGLAILAAGVGILAAPLAGRRRPR